MEWNETEIRVRYAETDKMGIVHHANYLVWFELGRSDFCRSRGFSYLDMEEKDNADKVVSEGFKGPVGDVYSFVESPRGELGFYLVSDGANKPYRMKVRPPSLCNLQPLRQLVQGVLVADVIAIMGSMDFILGDVDR